MSNKVSSRTHPISIGFRSDREGTWRDANSRRREGTFSVWTARLLLMTALFASTWCFAGYFPIGRLITLALTALALGVALFDSTLFSKHAERIPHVLSIALLAVLFSAIQLIPLSASIELIAPGLSDARRDFSEVVLEEPMAESELRDDVSTLQNAKVKVEDLAIADGAWMSTCLTLSRWETKTAVSTLVIGLAGLTLGWFLFQTDSACIFLLVGIGLCGASQVFGGIIQQVAYPDQIVGRHLNPGESTPFGSFLNRNHAADLLGMSIGCAIGLMTCSRMHWLKRSGRAYDRSTSSTRWLVRPETLAVMLLFGWLAIGLLLTLSRGGWISSALSLAGLWWFWRRSSPVRRKALAGALTSQKRSFSAIVVATLFVAISSMILAAGMTWSGSFEQIALRFRHLQVETMFTDARFEHWVGAFPAAAHFLPLGSGLGTYGYAHLPFTEPIGGTWYSHAHNQYLELFVETGIPGITLLFSGMVGCLVVIPRAFRGGRSPSETGIAVAAMIAFLMQSIHAISDFGLAMPSNLLALCVLIGAGVSATARTRKAATKYGGHKSGAGIQFDSISRRFRYSGQSINRLSPQPLHFAVAVSVLVVLSLMHLGHCVRIDNALKETKFSSRTPAPAVNATQDAIVYMTDLIERYPDAQHPRLRRARLRVHLVKRKLYDQLRAEAVDASTQPDARELWQRVSLENAIFILGKDASVSPDSTFQAMQMELSSELEGESELMRAFGELRELLSINPMRVKAQVLLTQVAAATGRPWRHRIQRLEQLSSGNPETTFAIGLLAMSAGNNEAMMRQWKQTIEFDVTKTMTIVDTVRQRVTDKALVDGLVPDHWRFPYRMALACKAGDETDDLRRLLLERALELVDRSDLEGSDRLEAYYRVSNEMEEYSAAAEWSLKAVQLDPKDPDLRYRAAKALVKSEKFDEAESHVRIAASLAPHEVRYKRLLTSLQRRNR